MRLSMKSKQERRIAEQLYKVRQQKEVIKTNRLIRENLYEHQRQKDFEEAINKEIIKSEKMHQEYHEQSLLLKQQYQSFVEKRKKKKHEKRIIMCSQIVDQLLEFSFKISEYKEFNDGKVPPSLIRECKTLFLNLKPITSNYNTEPMVDRVEPIPTIEIDPPPELIKSIPLELDPAVKVIDEEEFKQYVTGNGVWSFKTEAPPINAHLGTIISQILSYSQGDEKNRLVDPLPPLPLKLCLIGKPCSGKNSLSIRFTTHFDIKVYTADGIVQQTLHLLRDSPEEMDSKLLEMGQQAFQSLSSGNEVEDEVLTALVAHTLRQTKNSGFLLVGFPRTRLQAQLLEKELTGYEEMKPIKPGNLKRTGSSNPKQTKSLQKVKSLVAPDLVSSETPPTSHTGCFDAVVLLQMDVDTAVKRLTRKRIDPETNSIYLLDENPPPTNEIGIHDRLIPVDESKVGQIHIKMALFDEEIQKLGEWYSKIGNYMVIDASGSQDETWKLFENLVLELKEKKKNIETSPNPTTGGLVTSFGQSEIPKELDPEKEAVKEVELDKENDKERERDGEKEKEKEREKEKENVKDVEREKEKEGEKLKEKNIPEDKKKTPSSPKALPQSPLKKVSPELPKPVNVPAFTLDTLPEAYKHELKIEPSLKMMKVFADGMLELE
ncbi:Sperm flagellar protein 2 [Coelomomyces lativittatus]|nr:Sperm flagellar protein 2 [Coelomomyces lativittatus]